MTGPPYVAAGSFQTRAQPQVNGKGATARNSTANSTELNLLLVALPTVIGTVTISHIAALAALVVLATCSLLIAHQSTGRIKPTWPSAALPVVALMIGLRPNYPDTKFSALFFVIACAAVILAVYTSHSRSSAMASLIDGIGLFLLASIALRFAGFGPTSSETVVGNVLTGGDRVMFPLAISLAAAPAMAAAYLVAVAPIAVSSRNYGIFRLIGMAAALYILIQGDRRSALLSVVLIIAVAALAPLLFRRTAPAIIGFALSIPFAVRLLNNFFGTVSLAVLPILVRRGEGSGTLNIRLEIWSSAINFYQTNLGWVHQMVGFGTYGHVISGASSAYRNIFDGTYRSRALKSPHNTSVQLLFDGGWVAALSFVITVICLALLFAKRHSTPDLAGLRMLMSMSFVGATEVVLAPGNAQPNWWILLALSAIGFSRDSAGETLIGEPGSNGATGMRDLREDVHDGA